MVKRATQAQISACLIVRDEAALLPACLQSLAGCVDEVCVVDTGSTDATVAIAEAAGCRVMQMPWRDDFAEARNASLAMARGDWVFVIDADERVTETTRDRLRAAVAAATETQLAWAVLRHEDKRPGAAPVALPRLFRNHKDVHFARPIHESVMTSLLSLGCQELPDSGVRLVHLGYAPEVLATKDKVARNLRILRKHVRADPSDTFAYHKLIDTLPTAAWEERGQLYQTAYAQLEQSPPHMVRQQPFVPRLLGGFTEHLVADGQLAHAAAVVEFALRHFGDCGDLYHRAAEVARRRGDFDHAIASLGQAMAPRQASAIRFEQPAALAIRCHLTWHGLRQDGAAPPPIPALQGPTSVELVCAELRHRAFEEGPETVSRDVQRLIGRRAEHPALQLLHGELALLRGDATGARSHLSRTTVDSPAGQRAQLWTELLEATQDAAASPLGAKRRPVRDVADAALRLRLADPQAEADLSPTMAAAAGAAWLPRLDRIARLIQPVRGEA